MPSHKEICDACTLGGSFPVRGEGLSRRRLFRVAHVITGIFESARPPGSQD